MVFARLQRLAIVVSGIGDRGQRHDAERLLGRLRHAWSWPVSLPSLTAALAVLAKAEISSCLSSTAKLHVVAGHDPPALGEPPGVGGSTGGREAIKRRSARPAFGANRAGG